MYMFIPNVTKPGCTERAFYTRSKIANRNLCSPLGDLTLQNTSKNFNFFNFSSILG